MEESKNLPEKEESPIEKTESGAKKPLPKSTLIVGAVAAVIIIALTVALILALGSKKSDGESGDSQGDTAPTVTVDENGFVIVNGTKTEYKVDSADEITVSADGFVIVNGTKTEYKVDSADEITVSADGFVIVNGTETEYEIKKNHSFGEWTLYNEGETDCAKKIYRRTCSDCSTLEWKEGKYEDHVWGTEYISDASQHWKKCKNCAVLTAKEDHTEGDEGICTLCDAPLGDTAGIVYGVSADGTYAEVLGYDGTAKKVKIASEYNGLPVKTIYSEAFKENQTITSVIIPDSVTSIGSSAFSSCSSLKSVVIPDSVESIGYEAFASCSSLESVVIPDSVTSIGSSAFAYCSSLESVVIPDTVTSIGDYAFAYCSSLESVVIPDSVTSIGSSAFYNCNSALYTEYEYGKYVKSGDNPYAVLIEVTNKNFSTYTIHEDTKIIAYGAFKGCSRLTSITIPDGVRGIGREAFSSCSSLVSVVIGDSVTSISGWAFFGCSSLESVVIGDSVTSIDERAFDYCSSLRDVYYTGTEEEWWQISIGSDNSYLTYATIHFSYVPEE